MTILKATTTARTEGTTSHMLIWERHHGTLGPMATLTTVGYYAWLLGYWLGCYSILATDWYMAVEVLDYWILATEDEVLTDRPLGAAY